MLSSSPHTQALALEKLRASGVVIKQWAPEILDAFRKNTEIVLKERAENDADFAAGWPTSAPSSAKASPGAHFRDYPRVLVSK